MAETLLIARNEWRLLRGDPFPLLVLVGMPGVLLFFVADAFVGGPEQSVPGLASVFALMGIASTGFSFFREHGWGTWDRLRVAPVRPIEIVLGKAVPVFGLYLAQQVLLMVLGVTVFGLDLEGGAARLGLAALASASMYVALAIALTSLCRTVAQLNAAATLGAFVVSGAGGALAQLSALPSWVASIAPASPVYWAMKGYRSVLTGGEGFGEAVLVQLVFAVGAVAVTLWSFRVDEPKESYPGE